MCTSLSFSVQFLLNIVILANGQRFAVQPVSVIQAEGLEAVFECLYPGAFTHRWGIQGTFVSDARFPHDMIRIPPLGESPAKLIIPATPLYNGTIVQCKAVIEITSGLLQSRFSSNATLYIQGKLQPPLNLRFAIDMSSNATISIIWDPPFSLNLTTAEPDIKYCVDVYNATADECNNTAELLSECFTETIYFFSPLSPNSEQIYCFKITSSSNVLDSLNRTMSKPVTACGYTLSKPVIIPAALLSYEMNAGLSFIRWKFPSSVLNQMRSVPTMYSVNLESIDSYSSRCNCFARSDIITSQDLITLTLQWCVNCNIRRHRIYNYTVTTINGAGSSVSIPKRLSTHDVQNFQVQIINNYQLNTTAIKVTCSFLDGSTSPGTLVIVQSQTNSSNVYYAMGKRSSTQVLIDRLSGDMYDVVVYDRGENQLPEVWPAGSQTISFDDHYPYGGFVHHQLSLWTPEVLFDERGQLCINCTPNIQNMTACIVIIHSKHNSKLLSQQLKVYSINTSNVFEHLSINEEEFNIAVFGLFHDTLERTPVYTNFFKKPEVFTTREYEETTDVAQSSAASPYAVIAIGSSLCALFLLLLGVFVSGIACILICRTHTSKLKAQSKVNSQNFSSGTIKQNEAYNLVNIFTTNKAYSAVNIDNSSSRILSTPTHDRIVPAHIYDEPRLPCAQDIKPTTAEQDYAEVISSATH